MLHAVDYHSKASVMVWSDLREYADYVPQTHYYVMRVKGCRRKIASIQQLYLYSIAAYIPQWITYRPNFLSVVSLGLPSPRQSFRSPSLASKPVCTEGYNFPYILIQTQEVQCLLCQPVNSAKRQRYCLHVISENKFTLYTPTVITHLHRNSNICDHWGQPTVMEEKYTDRNKFT